MTLSLVINSPLNAHLAPLSVSPSNRGLPLIIRGLTQASPAVHAASQPSHFLFYAVSLVVPRGRPNCWPRTVWSGLGVGVVVWCTITTGWLWEGVCVCVCVCVCREFIVVCECERVHLSLSLLFLRAVYCLIQWLRNEACRKPGKMSKGLFTVALQLVHSRHVTGCGSRHASGSGTERNGVPASVCVQSLFFLFS